MSFSRFSQALSQWAGSPRTFLVALVLLLLWASSGPYFHFNDTWQLIVNTSTTIITFLMVFLIQNTQNRDNDTLHLKIDELLRATKTAHNALLNLDQLTTKDLRTLRKQYAALSALDAHEDASVEGLCQKLAESEKTSAAADEKPV